MVTPFEVSDQPKAVRVPKSGVLRLWAPANAPIGPSLRPAVPVLVLQQRVEQDEKYRPTVGSRSQTRDRGQRTYKTRMHVRNVTTQLTHFY